MCSRPITGLIDRSEAFVSSSAHLGRLARERPIERVTGRAHPAPDAKRLALCRQCDASDWDAYFNPGTADTAGVDTIDECGWPPATRALEPLAVAAKHRGCAGVGHKQASELALVITFDELDSPPFCKRFLVYLPRFLRAVSTARTGDVDHSSIAAAECRPCEAGPVKAGFAPAFGGCRPGNGLGELLAEPVELQFCIGLLAIDEFRALDGHSDMRARSLDGSLSALSAGLAARAEPRLRRNNVYGVSSKRAQLRLGRACWCRYDFPQIEHPILIQIAELEHLGIVPSELIPQTVGEAKAL